MNFLSGTHPPKCILIPSITPQHKKKTCVNDEEEYLSSLLVNHADVSREVRVFTDVCLSVFSARYLKFDTLTFHYESLKSIYFEIKRSKVKSRVANTAPTWVFALL